MSNKKTIVGEIPVHSVLSSPMDTQDKENTIVSFIVANFICRCAILDCKIRKRNSNIKNSRSTASGHMDGCYSRNYHWGALDIVVNLEEQLELYHSDGRLQIQLNNLPHLLLK